VPVGATHVLLVEDEPAFVTLCWAVLDTADEPMRLSSASSLAAALDAIRLTAPDIVLLDLNLPDSTGLATLREVLSAAPELPVVVLTGVSAPGVPREALRLGAQDWLGKDRIDPDSLPRTLRYAIERKRLENQLIQAQKLEIAGRLATGVAHEFNNVLTAIVGSAQLFQEAADQEGRDAAMQLLRRTARQGTALSRQLLSLARNPPRNEAIVPVATLVTAGLALVQAVLPSTIALEVGPLSDVDVAFDPGQFDQMLLNLVFNAKDAMPEGGRLGIRVDLEVGAPDVVRPAWEGRDRLCAVLRVSDTGVGIDASVLPRLFEPFFTTKGGIGTGLGLAVTAEIVERFGGAIRVDSRVGTGTTFAVWLPAV
jgi:two-component system cell cycle sensor histidine kinase/response regulator CckA